MVSTGYESTAERAQDGVADARASCAVPPRSRRRRLDEARRRRPARARPPRRGRPRPWRSISATERSIAAGFAMPCPAICGAEPCTGSKRPGPSSPSEADAARPEAARHRGRDVGEDVAEGVLGDDDVDRLRARSRSSSRTSRRARGRAARRGTRPAPSSVTTSRQRREVCMHVDLVDRGQAPATLARDLERRGVRSARPPAASTRTCRTTCRPRGCPSRRSRGRRRARARSSRSIPLARSAGRRFA